MGKIIAIVNQKGGVGKTTTAVNLTAALTDLGKRVLLCDFDPQANATSGMGVDKRKIKYSSYDVTINGVDIQSAIVGTQFGDVLPSSADLAGAAVELIGTEDREHQLKRALESVKDSYDCIFVDCPPSLELLTLNALCAADGILVPVQCEYYALEGLSDLMATLRTVKKRLNPKLEIFCVVLTMYDGRTNFSAQVAGGPAALPREGAEKRGPPECPPGRGPQPRPAGDSLRQAQPWLRGLQRNGGRNRGEALSLLSKSLPCVKGGGTAQP